MVASGHDLEKKLDADWSYTTYKEFKTGGGQLLEATVDANMTSEEKEIVEKALLLIKRISIPETRLKVNNINHGGYGQWTRFDIEQHKYAGGHGYIEAIEIKNAPDGRCSFVFHEYRPSEGSEFIEFNSLDELKAAWEMHWHGNKEFKSMPGYIRKVECGFMDPWFYAIADQNIFGDFVFPDVVYDHPIYRPMKKFILLDDQETPVIKTCLGCNEWETDSRNEKKYKVKKIYFTDGSVWDSCNSTKEPTPLEGENLLAHESVGKYLELLSGKEKKFEIPFIDGTKFIGRISEKPAKHKAGKYYVALTLKDKKGIRKFNGSFSFIPTKEVPTIEQNIYNQANGKPVEILSIDKCFRMKGDYGNKKWSGVYNMPTAEEG